MELRVGNKYRLGRKIGSGSFGDIYLGKCPWFQLWGQGGGKMPGFQALKSELGSGAAVACFGHFVPKAIPGGEGSSRLR